MKMTTLDNKFFKTGWWAGYAFWWTKGNDLLDHTDFNVTEQYLDLK